jgi:threonine dehydratase
MSAVSTVTIADVHAARERIAGRVRRTSLTSSATLSRLLGTNVSLKLELFQKTGSFKPRGAFNKILADVPAGKRIVAVSGGNHAQAVAYAATALGIHSTIVMPQTTPANYLDATREYGAEVVLAENIAEAFDVMEKIARDGAKVVHPFDDPFVIAGQATVGLEILEDLPNVTDIVVSIGGGGLAGGIGLVAKSFNPQIRVWGVETVGADAMAQAVAAGKPVPLTAITSIARTLGAPEVTWLTLGLVQQYLESVTVVPDSEAVTALEVLLERAKVLTEPAAACTLAAARRLKANFTPESQVVLVLCGGNVSLSDVCRYRALA